MIQPYRNEPFSDFTCPIIKAQAEEALAFVHGQKRMHYPIVIGGQRKDTQTVITSLNPSDYKEVIGTAGNATLELAQEAVEAATKAFESWKRVPATVRSQVLFKTAAIMRRRKMELSAWMVEEAGKNWPEADADTAEAIDFLEYYGRSMLAYDQGMNVLAMPGEVSECKYIPLGVGVVISPWNFPLAILTGMVAAAIVAGNTVIMKPASPTVVIAAKLFSILEEAGVPEGVVNYLPGPGSLVGNALVGHPGVRFINFTGSLEVGLSIHKQAAQLAKGQRWIKRTVLELGGKDAMVVDETANLVEAADAIIAAAFGFSGQKCSACSRAIIVKDVYDEMLSLLEERMKGLTVGKSATFGVSMGPVIDEKAYNNVLNYIEIGKGEGRIISPTPNMIKSGYFIAPTIIADVDRNARIAQEEIFGPVLAVIKAEDYDDALAIVNSSAYGLTGGLFSGSRERLSRAREDFHVGNLYLNRKCTGALVGVQPFGGFGLSGTDSKAGGADYVGLFLQAKSITEKL